MGNEKNEISAKAMREIENYLLGHMNAEESLSFEKRMQGDPLLRNQVDDLKVLIKAIEIDSLKDQLRNISADVENENPKSGRPIGKWLIAAALLALIGTASFWLLKRAPLHERLFDSYFYKDPGLPTTMGNSKNLAFTEAMTNYKLGNYDAAIQEWENMLKTDSDNDTLNYFIGMGYLANNNAQKSTSFLESAASNKHSVFLSDTYHYLALAYLKLGEIDRAKKMLIQCPHKDCTSILSELSK